MDNNFKLTEYLSSGIENIIKNAVKASLDNPKESIFIAKYALSSKKSKKLRTGSEEKGLHVPPFLIASITNSCNLHCKGCYARANHSCNDQKRDNLLTCDEWDRIFTEAENIGVGFILLAGGEPLLRRDVIEKATKHKNIIFPVFTNGTMLDNEYLALFDKNRNLIPVLSIEGNRKLTDDRRGEGVYNRLNKCINSMCNSGVFFGASVTVTKENIENVLSDDFVSELYDNGCKLIFYVEYVPVTSSSKNIAPDDGDREYLENRLSILRAHYINMIMIAFPGDEKASGGCLAAGRGFFHINSHGGAEPCPFSPYSDTDLRNMPLIEALNSPLFMKLQSKDILNSEHTGGCVLFEQEDKVKALISK